MDDSLGDLFSSVKFVAFDVDGVLHSGSLERKTQVLGGYKLISELRRKGIKMAIVPTASNWSTYEFWALMRYLGFLLDVDEIWGAPRVAAQYLRRELDRCRCFVVGEGGLSFEFESFGHEIVRDWRKADAVVLGYDRNLTFDKLTNVLRAINNREAYFLAVSKPKWYYDPDYGPLISPGALVTALEFQTGRKATVVGKPSLIHFNTVLDFFKVKPSESLMVGDSMDADIIPAKSLGMKTVLVKAVERWEKTPIENPEVVDAVVHSVDDLAALLRSK